MRSIVAFEHPFVFVQTSNFSLQACFQCHSQFCHSSAKRLFKTQCDLTIGFALLLVLPIRLNKPILRLYYAISKARLVLIELITDLVPPAPRQLVCQPIPDTASPRRRPDFLPRRHHLRPRLARARSSLRSWSWSWSLAGGRGDR